MSTLPALEGGATLWSEIATQFTDQELDNALYVLAKLVASYRSCRDQGGDPADDAHALNVLAAVVQRLRRGWEARTAELDREVSVAFSRALAEVYRAVVEDEKKGEDKSGQARMQRDDYALDVLHAAADHGLLLSDGELEELILETKEIHDYGGPKYAAEREVGVLFGSLGSDDNPGATVRARARKAKGLPSDDAPPTARFFDIKTSHRDIATAAVRGVGGTAEHVRPIVEGFVRRRLAGLGAAAPAGEREARRAQDDAGEASTAESDNAGATTPPQAPSADR